MPTPSKSSDRDDHRANTTTLTRGVRIAPANLHGDGFDDISTGAGATTAANGGQGPLVSLFDGRTLAEIDSFIVDDLDTTHGLFVAGSPRRRK